MKLKSFFIGLSFFYIYSFSYAQQKKYKITYRHCFERNSTMTLRDTVGIEAVLIGDATYSNYNFLKGNGSPAYKLTEGQPKTIEEAIKSKFEGRVFINSSPIDSIGNMSFHDKRKDSVFVREKMTDNYVLTAEKTPFIDWIITTDTKLIKGHECQKATAHFRGRDYTAWFAKDLAIVDGPWKFYGLPGLLMDITDSNRQLKIYVEKIEFPYLGNIPGFVPFGNHISLSDYFSFLPQNSRKQAEAINALLQNQEHLPEGVVPHVTGNNVAYSIEKSFD